MPAAAAAAVPAAALLSLVPELQVQILRGLGPADLRSARLACSALCSLADSQVVTGLKLDVVRPQRCLEAGSILEPEHEQYKHDVIIRPSLAELQNEEAGILAELSLDLPQLALQLLAMHDTLFEEQQGTAELQLLAQQHGGLVGWRCWSGTRGCLRCESSRWRSDWSRQQSFRNKLSCRSTAWPRQTKLWCS